MTKTATVIALFALVALSRVAAEPTYLAKSDHLNYLDENAKSIKILKANLTAVDSTKARAAIYWRLARDTFDIANARSSRSGNAGLQLSLYKKSEKYADRTIALDPQSPKGYYWKAACVGEIAQIRNLVRAFLKAGEVRDLLFKAARRGPSDGEVWYVLGRLYSRIPGFPLSFGNAVYAVSLGRKGLAARKAQVAKGTEQYVPEGYYIQLARELVHRGWSKTEREQRQPQEAKKYHGTSNPVKKNFYYEGIVHIPAVSDKAEAIEIDKGVVKRLEAMANRTPTQNQALRKARRDLKKWER